MAMKPKKRIPGMFSDKIFNHKIDKNLYTAPTLEEAGRLIRAEGLDAQALFLLASAVREAFRGNTVHLCAILNAKSGRCSEDCAFCSQSAWAKSEVDCYPLMSSAEILSAARKAADAGAMRFSIVTSGRGISGERELETVLEAVEGIHSLGLLPCASLGMLDEWQIKRLAEAGLERLHHNIETAESHYPAICSTHSYAQRIETVIAAHAAGVKVCCGGIFGLGENLDQRVEMIYALKELPVDSIPVNFINPRPGTRLADIALPSPLDCLKVVALLRLVMPERRILIAGGRENCLRDLHPLLFMAGADGLMIGDYLTTAGRRPADDLRMLADLGLEVAGRND